MSWFDLIEDANLLGRWTGDNNNDGIGDANSTTGLGNGTVVGTVAYSEDRPSGHTNGKSFDLNGNGHISCGDLGAANGNAVTFTAWVKSAGSQSNYAGIFLSRGSAACGISQRATTGEFGYNWNNQSNTYNYDTNLLITTGEWRFVSVAVTSGAGVVTVNGSSVTNSVSHASCNYDANVLIGADTAQVSSGRWKGLIYDPRIYRRTLSPSEISEIYLGPEPMNIVAPSLSGYFIRGQTIVCNVGVWNGFNNGSISYSYQWQRDVEGNSVFTNINGATNSTYALTETDLNNSIRCLVSASNNGGNNPGFDTASDAVSFRDFTINARNIIAVPSQDNNIVSYENGSAVWSGSHRSQGHKKASKNVDQYMHRLYNRFKPY